MLPIVGDVSVSAACQLRCIHSSTHLSILKAGRKRQPFQDADPDAKPDSTEPGFDRTRHPTYKGRGLLLRLLPVLLRRQRKAKMGDARCMLSFLVTLAVCYVSSSVAGSGIRVGRSTTWKVATILDFPYSRKKTTTATKNEDYEGYVPDVLKKIGEELNQEYTIHVVGDSKYGAKDPSTNTWTGMIGEIVAQKADVAAAAITISDARKEVVDFTEPLMSIEVVILLKKPSDGSEVSIKSAENLADQTDIKFGVVKDGTTFQLIRNSTLPHFQKIFASLNADASRLISTSEEGVNMVRREGGKFAFITESATGNYWANLAPCDLVQIKISLPKTEYAFAVGKGSAIKAQLDGAIRKLKENGELEKIRQKWWEHQCSSGAVHSWGALIALPLFVLVLEVAASPGFD